MKNILLGISFLLTFPLVAQQRGATPVTNHQSPVTGTTRAVILGISDYQDPSIPDLRFADRDAEAFANFLRSPAAGSLGDDHLRVLLNHEATMAQFANALDWLMEHTKENDQAIIYFSGHGDVEKKTLTQPGFLLCWDAPARVYMAGGAFALPMLQEVISTLSIQNKAKVIVITDACRSGKLSGSAVNGSQLTNANLAQQAANEIKILSCQANEYSIEGEQWGGGRGAFSYHLIDGLFGMADGNNDQSVTLMEIGRYLEDKVTTEVAPVSQVPLSIGNRTERLANVNPEVLASLQSGKVSQMFAFSAVDSRGMEEDVLAAVDEDVQQMYAAFRQSLKDKHFFEPSGASADDLYKKLIAVEQLKPLHNHLRRNYAAALQDDAQQLMNAWLNADVQEIDRSNNSIRREHIPGQLERAAYLLGENHYMYRSLLARKYFFEAVLLHGDNRGPDETLARQCLRLFHRALEMEPELPHIWYGMSEVYACNLRQPDSAFICAKAANNIVPNWVRPMVTLGFHLSEQKQFDLAKQALETAQAIDSLHPFVINAWADWYVCQPSQENFEKAVELYEKYRDNGGVMYAVWHNNYANTQWSLGRYREAEAEYLKALALDSTNARGWGNLGGLYIATLRNAEGEKMLQKALLLDSTLMDAWSTLGYLFQISGRHNEAERYYKKAIQLDSTLSYQWTFLGDLYTLMERYAEGELAYKKAIGLDSFDIYAWYTLGHLYMYAGRYAEAEQHCLKATEIDPENPSTWLTLGVYYDFVGKVAQAEASFIKAVALDTASFRAANRLGYFYLQMGRYEEAGPLLKMAVELSPTFVLAQANLGAWYNCTGQPDMAEPLLLKAVEMDTMEAFAKAELGKYYYDRGQYAKAASLLQQAVVMDKNNGYRYQTILAKVRLDTGRPEDARQGFLAALKKNPFYAPAALGLAYILIAEGKQAEAIAQVEQAIQKGSTLRQLTFDKYLTSLKEIPAWEALMKKYFPNQFKD